MKSTTPTTIAWFGCALLCALACTLLSTNAYAVGVTGEPGAEAMEPPPPDERDPGEGERFGPPAGRDFRGEGPGRRRAGKPGAMLWGRMSEEEREELRTFMAENFPERVDDMLELEETDTASFRRHVGRLIPEMMRLRELSARDPELFEVRRDELKNEFKLRRLARRYRFAGDDNAREELATQMRPLVEKQFDLRQRRMELEVVRLEQKIVQIRENIAHRAENRDAAIDRLLERILREGPRRGPRFHADKEGREHRKRHREREDPEAPVAVPEPDTPR